MFHIGQQVVCVDDGPSWVGASVPLIRGQVYTIADFDPPEEDGDIELGVYLCEVSVEEDECHTDSFRASRFRPVRKTDISIFTALLNSVPQKEPCTEGFDLVLRHEMEGRDC